MRSSDIRKTFLEFFRQRGHEVLRSSSLIPRNDPTLLFTNAGMVQFKSVFLGEEPRPYKRAATCQKCLRAGGKHSDIENVGHTSRHHTFFEMLGNFSFGDYFKREAIAYAWELLTEGFKLPADKLWATVYEEDDEAAALWREVVGLPEERIVRLGAKDNFWQMADTGPCGPCSEIIIDQGPAVGCGRPDCRVGCDCDRYLELWNLVFMQYNRDEQGKLAPLPNPSIDTGMGIERIAAVLQGKLNNFDTDLFTDIISAITAETGVPYGKGEAETLGKRLQTLRGKGSVTPPDTDVSIRVIADHARTMAFLLCEGLVPSNEGRGYVLRRIIRRAARHARLLGGAAGLPATGPVLYKILDSVAESMGGAYPELIEERERSAKILKVEEERFIRTLEQGMRMLDELLVSLKKANLKTIPGEEVFKLYDTYGFPVDLVKDIAVDGGFELDEAGFHRAMAVQREKARASWVGEEAAIAPIYRELLSEAGRTEFAGYETIETDSVLRAIVKEGRVVEEVGEGEEAEVFLDRTPFYGESGGQVGDTGIMASDGIIVEVKDTQKPLEGVISHHIGVKKGTLRVWSRLKCRVDVERRKAVMRNHTATHLLQAALRGVLGEHVKQAGSLVEPGRLRFDFTHFTSLTPEEREAIEGFVNERVLDNLPVGTKEMELSEALALGSIALFGEKYGERVRMVSVGGVSRELCGGTHIGATGEIGPFVVVSEGSVAAGIRRIEALTGKAAMGYLKEKQAELEALAKLLKTDKPAERVSALVAELKDVERDMQRLKGEAAKDIAREMLEKARQVDGVRVVSGMVEGLGMEELRALADNVRDKIGSGVIFLASKKDDQASMVAMVTDDLAGRYNAGEILKKIASASGGRGGGKTQMAQGGTKEPEKLTKAIEMLDDLIRGQ